MATQVANRTLGPATLAATYDTVTMFVSNLTISVASGSIPLKIGKKASGFGDASFFNGTLVAGTPRSLPLPGNTYTMVIAPSGVPIFGGSVVLTQDTQSGSAVASPSWEHVQDGDRAEWGADLRRDGHADP